MKAERSRLVGTFAIVLLAPVGIVTAAIGGTDGNPRDQVWEQCQQYPCPEGLAPHPEAINVGGERTLFPLGLICTYGNPNTAAFRVSIAHPQCCPKGAPRAALLRRRRSSLYECPGDDPLSDVR